MKVLIYAGPTASGKSALAFERASSQNGVILNGDSLQVYQGIEILTAQPSLAEQQDIPHRLYGFLDSSEACSVGRWLPLVLAEIEKAHAVGQLPIIVGGTGLYLKALVEGLSPLPSVDPQVREDLKQSGRNLPELYQDLQQVDPLLANRVSSQDKQRILRGLEVFYGTGTPLSVWQTQPPSPPPYDFETILLMPPADLLEGRIKERLERMLDQGLVEEVSRAMLRPFSINAQKAIGFMEFKAFLEGESSFEEAKALTLLHTRQYAKRQRTWFRNQ